MRPANHFLAILVSGMIIAAHATDDAKAESIESYPNRPITLVVPFAPGGGTDIVARVISEKLGQATGQAVVVDNRAGAGGTIGSASGARAAADGYTLTFATASTHGVAPGLYTDLSYDAVEDFAPVSLLVTTPFVLAVKKSMPVDSVSELIELARKNPGKLNYGSAGVGSSNQLTVELFKMMAKLDIVHIPYKGSGPALVDLAAGRVDLVINDMSSLLSYITSDRVKALAVTSEERSPTLPDLPTIDEEGLQGYEALAWYGVLAPRDTPPPIIEKLNSLLNEITQAPEMQERFQSMGFNVVNWTPDEFRSFMISQIEKWTEVIEVSGAKAE
ncbi:tripartite tricarboxylate transporter substrate binding protein [Alcaligenaceae bacterium]|nr:tripartite tricarboxylate transporter substrate binding protein [Alcaligenaceae bacterium]